MRPVLILTLLFTWSLWTNGQTKASIEAMPDPVRARLISDFARMLQLEQTENWYQLYDLLVPELRNSTTREEYSTGRKNTIWGHNLVGHRIDTIEVNGDAVNGYLVFIGGCAKMNRMRKGVATFSEAIWDGNRWQFVPLTTRHGIDGPNETCKF